MMTNHSVKNLDFVKKISLQFCRGRKLTSFYLNFTCFSKTYNKFFLLKVNILNSPKPQKDNKNKKVSFILKDTAKNNTAI